MWWGALADPQSRFSDLQMPPCRCDSCFSAHGRIVNSAIFFCIVTRINPLEVPEIGVLGGGQQAGEVKNAVWGLPEKLNVGVKLAQTWEFDRFDRTNVSGMSQNMCVHGRMAQFRQETAKLWPNYCQSGRMPPSHHIAVRWMVSNFAGWTGSYHIPKQYNTSFNITAPQSTASTQTNYSCNPGTSAGSLN